MEIQNQTELAIPLIFRDNQSEKFQVNEQALKFISGVPQPISVVSMVGLYRTGKSYLLNKMLLNRSRGGFEVGSTVNACTKGLWIWPEVIKGRSKDNKEVNVLIVDTEGIGSLEEDSNYDIKTFVLGILISSCFVYSSVGAIQTSSIENLSLVVYLTEMLGKKLGSKIEKPDFIWVLRDFNLALRDQQGNSFTSSQYLQKALAEEKGNSEASANRNRIKNCIKEFFKQRECVTFVRPLSTGELQNLMAIPFEKLQPEFVQTLLTTKNRLVNQTSIKMFGNEEIDGRVLSLMIEKYTDAMNSDCVPNIMSAWESITEQVESQQVVEILGAVGKQIDQIVLPVNQQSLKSQFCQIKQKALRKIQHLTQNSQSAFLKQFNKKQANKLKLNDELAKQLILKHLNNKLKQVQKASNLDNNTNDSISSSLINYQNQLLLLQQQSLKQLSKHSFSNFNQVLTEWKLKVYESKWSHFIKTIQHNVKKQQQKQASTIERYKQQIQRQKKELKFKREEYELEIMSVKNSKLKLECQLSIQQQKYNSILNKSVNHQIQNTFCNPNINQSLYSIEQFSPSKHRQNTRELNKQIEMLKQQGEFKDIKYRELSVKYEEAKKSQNHYLSIISNTPMQNKMIFNESILKEINNQESSNLKERIRTLEEKCKNVSKQSGLREMKILALEQQNQKLKEQKVKMQGNKKRIEGQYEQKIRQLDEDLRALKIKYQQQVSKNYQLAKQNEQCQQRVKQFQSKPSEELQDLKKIYQQEKIARQRSIEEQRNKLEQRYKSKIEELQLQCKTKTEELESTVNSLEQQIQLRVSLEQQMQNLQSKCQFYKQDIRIKQRSAMIAEKAKMELEIKVEIMTRDLNSTKEQLKSLKQGYETQLNKEIQQVKKQTDNEEVKLREQVKLLNNRIEQMKQRYHNNERQYLKKINEQQISSASAIQKHTLLEHKLKKSKEEYQNSFQQLQNKLKLTTITLEETSKRCEEMQTELGLKIEELQSQKNNVEENYDNDKLLWKNRFEFMEQQKVSLKQHYTDKLKKLEETIEFLSKNQENQTYEKIVNEVAKKYQQYGGDTNYYNNEETNRRWEEQIRELKMDKERLVVEHQKSLNSEKEVRNLKIREMEERLKEAEYRKQMVVSQHEREKNEWKKQRLGFMKLRKFVQGNTDN